MKKMETARFVHGGNIYESAADGGVWLDFSANINPLGISERVREALLQHIDAVIHYPDPEMRELRAALAAHYRLPAGGFLCGNGAAELFYLYFFVKRPKRVLLPVPSFSEYERSARAAGADVHFFYLEEKDAFRPDLMKILQEVSRIGADCVVLGNPNNPTGTLLRRQELMALARGLKNVDCQLLIDESFLDFRRDEADFTLRQDAAAQENILLVRSLTKFFAIPGLRLGFALGPKQLLHEMEQAKDVWNVNLLAQAAGAAMLSDQMYQKQTRAFIAAEKENLARRLKAIGHLRVYPPSVNFLFVRLEWTQHTDELLDFLRQKHILIRDCRHYPGLGRGFLRLAVRTRAENDRLLAAWQSYALLQGHEK